MNPNVRLPKTPVVYGRQQSICARSHGRRVLHLGCVDAGLVEDRFARGELMHQKLVKVAAELWGADIDGEGIAFLREQGFGNLFAGDIIDGIPELESQSFDVIVASEVLEHLDNPGLFLDAVRNLMTPSRTELIVTVPNAYRLDSLLSMWRGVENVHPDHNYWFSYYTLTNLLRKRGFEIAEVLAYSLQPGGLLPERLAGRVGANRQDPRGFPDAAAARPRLLRRVAAYFRTIPRRALVSLLYRRTSFWADGIIVVAHKPS